MTFKEFNPRTLVNSVKRNFMSQYVEIESDMGVYYVYVSLEVAKLRSDKIKYNYSIVFENFNKDQEQLEFRINMQESDVLNALIKFKENHLV